jgi:energy-coupling factor transport system permease protein
MTSMKFQTVERDSIFTRLDFRPKMVMMLIITVIAFFWESSLMQAALCVTIGLACLFAGVKLGYLRNLVWIMVPFYLFLIVTMGFFNVQQVQTLLGRQELTPIFAFPESWWLVGGGEFTVEGVLYGINVMFKTLTMVLVVPLAIFTTDVDNMVVGMVRGRIPYKIAFIFSSTLRFFPLLFEEIQSIIEAQRLRGLAMEKMGPVKRVRVFSKVAVPLILGAMVKSQQLEVVLQSKAFTGDPNRTYLHASILKRADYTIMAIFVLLLIAVVVLYFATGLGKFGGPVDFIH